VGEDPLGGARGRTANHRVGVPLSTRMRRGRRGDLEGVNSVGGLSWVLLDFIFFCIEPLLF
jgi:hypothetical protein